MPSSTPWNSQAKKCCFSRSDFLKDTLDTAFATGQSMTVGSSGESKKDEETWPTNWPKTGRVLRVPKCVILSSLPNWTAYWPHCYFNGPRDVLSLDPTGRIVNYYYFEQWNNTTDDISTDAGIFDPNSLFFTNFDKVNLPDPRKPDKYLYSSHYNDELNNRPHTGTNLIDTSLPPPAERFNQVIGNAINPYYLQHQELLSVFNAAKRILEKEHDIWVVVPQWLNPRLYQVRNFFLTKTRWKLNPGHGGIDNGRPCDVTDANPCYNLPSTAWGPAYPNTLDPRNNLNFEANQVPFLTSADPGFGTNMLHIFVGHPVVRFSAGKDPWSYQAWPLTPELLFFGDILEGTYISQSDLLPFFNGRRNLWGSSGLDYGFLGADGVNSIYNWYHNIYMQGIGKYKDNFYKYRNFTTKIFTYSKKWQFLWSTSDIRRDRKNDCPATQFYFGSDFGDYSSTYDGVDTNITDCLDQAHLKFGETHNYFPSQAEINYALTVTFPPIQDRIEKYYNGMEPGSADIFNKIINENDLTRYNVSYEGSCEGIKKVTDLVDYILAYFKKHP